jgi:hypothetical protein
LHDASAEGRAQLGQAAQDREAQFGARATRGDPILASGTYPDRRATGVDTVIGWCRRAHEGESDDPSIEPNQHVRKKFNVRAFVEVKGAAVREEDFQPTSLRSHSIPREQRDIFVGGEDLTGTVVPRPAIDHRDVCRNVV